MKEGRKEGRKEEEKERTSNVKLPVMKNMCG
jgi:hypothetical protein